MIFSESFKELALLRQLFMSISFHRCRDSRIEEDSENSTSSKDLLVRNVFPIFFFYTTPSGNSKHYLERVSPYFFFFFFELERPKMEP